MFVLLYLFLLLLPTWFSHAFPFFYLFYFAFSSLFALLIPACFFFLSYLLALQRRAPLGRRLLHVARALALAPTPDPVRHLRGGSRRRGVLARAWSGPQELQPTAHDLLHPGEWACGEGGREFIDALIYVYMHMRVLISKERNSTSCGFMNERLPK